MNPAAIPAIQALNQRFFVEFPLEAAHELETLPAADIARTFATHPPSAVLRPWQRLTPDIAGDHVRIGLAGEPGLDEGPGQGTAERAVAAGTGVEMKKRRHGRSSLRRQATRLAGCTEDGLPPVVAPTSFSSGL